MRWYSRIAIGIFVLAVLLEVFMGFGHAYPWHQYLLHLLAVPLAYAIVAWVIMRLLAAAFSRRSRG
ncbi:MAG TPA: hypothetical protein VFQ88_03550 [Nevskiaceae bacterium]|nr:hypothetical protein [Nevskiaceae bacterium]